MATTFSRTARSERHFTALLLPHLLMSNNFAGSRALFKKLGLYEGKAFDPSDVEIVAELNPIRDVVGRSTNPNAAPLENKVKLCLTYLFELVTARCLLKRSSSRILLLRPLHLN